MHCIELTRPLETPDTWQQPVLSSTTAVTETLRDTWLLAVPYKGLFISVSIVCALSRILKQSKQTLCLEQEWLPLEADPYDNKLFVVTYHF